MQFKIMTNKAYQYPFGSYMQQCEYNYSLLCRLMPVNSDDDYFSYLLDDDSKIELQITEKHAYTTFITLTQRHLQSQQELLDFNLYLRLYHDARQVEVFTPEGRAMEAINAYPNPAMHQTDEKYNINHFLNDLLLHALQHGRSTETLV